MPGWPFDPNFDAPTTPRAPQSRAPQLRAEVDAHAAMLALQASQRRAAANRSLLVGVVLLAIGIAITAATFESASSNPRGGTYIVMWGPIAVGIANIFRGLFRR